MGITAKVVADSVTPDGQRLISWELRYPRFIHQEFMTHRAFSRNASSSRAVPVSRMIREVVDNPAMPVSWGSNQPGMVAGAEVSEADRDAAIQLWLQGRTQAVSVANALHAMGLHKQIVNRVLEPFSHIRVLCSATETDNFFKLRDHPNAQPEMQALARAMRAAMDASTPRKLGPRQWHLPYIERADYVMFDTYEGAEWDGTGAHPISTLIKLSVARCARVSYRNAQGHLPATDHDLSLYQRLMSDTPMHASPAEHQATPVVDECSARLAAQSNFSGWVQYRKIVELR